MSLAELARALRAYRGRLDDLEPHLRELCRAADGCYLDVALRSREASRGARFELTSDGLARSPGGTLALEERRLAPQTRITGSPR